MTLPKALQAETLARPMNGEEAAKAFAAFRRKKDSTKAKLRTEMVAKLLSVGLPGETANPLTEMIADLTRADVRRVWTPSEAFFKRLTKGQLLDLHAHIVGQGFRSKTLAKHPKAEVAKWVALIIKGGKGAPNLDADQRARADAWVPDGMVRAETQAEDTNGASQAA